MLAMADAGLRARGHGEEGYLDPLHRIADSGVTLAEEKRQRVASDFHGDPNALYEAYAF